VQRQPGRLDWITARQGSSGGCYFYFTPRSGSVNFNSVFHCKAYLIKAALRQNSKGREDWHEVCDESAETAKHERWKNKR